MIVRRPDVDQRELLDVGRLDLDEGLVGDDWKWKGSSATPDGSADPLAQITLINARLAALVSQGGHDRWALAGDQLYVDLDLSEDNLPAGSRLSIGSAVIELTAKPHTGCSKFAARFGIEAVRFVNTPIGRGLRLRGANAFVVVPGELAVGDTVRVERPATAVVSPTTAEAPG